MSSVPCAGFTGVCQWDAGGARGGPAPGPQIGRFSRHDVRLRAVRGASASRVPSPPNQPEYCHAHVKHTTVAVFEANQLVKRSLGLQPCSRPLVWVDTALSRVAGY